MENISSPVFESAFNVFTALRTSNKVVHDDTQIEKFIGWVEGMAETGDTAKLFLSNAEVESFLSYAADQQQDEPFQALVLALRIGPSLLHAVTPSTRNHENLECSKQSYPPWIKIFQAAQKEEPWAEASVRNAWVLGLDRMSSSETGVFWCLKSGLTATLIGLLEDESIFVRKEARKLILSIDVKLSSAVKIHDGLSAKICQSYEDLTLKIWRVIRAPLTSGRGDSDYRNIGTSLDFLQGLCRNKELENSDIKSKLCSDENIFIDLLQLLENPHIFPKRSIVTEIVSTIQDVIEEYERKDMTSNLDRNLMKWPVDLMRKQKMYSAMALASALISRMVIEAETLREVSLFPLYLLTGRPFTSEVKEIPEASFAEALESKTLCVDALLQMIRIIATTEELRGPEVNEDLTELLNVSLGCGHYSKRVITENGINPVRLKMKTATLNHKRIQMALLELFIQLNEKNSIQERQTQMAIIEGCLQLLDQQGIPPPLSNKAYSCIVLFITSVTTSGTVGGTEACPSLTKCLDSLTERIKMGLCDIAWEVRDSAVELIEKLIHACPEGSVVCSWLVSSSLVGEVWKSVEDGQSYVRASAVRALSPLPNRPSLWEQLLTSTTQVEVLDKVCSIVEQDTEAFARRAAVKLLCDWSTCPALSSHRSTILTAINQAITDLDWEVKMSVLNYWSSVLENDAREEVPEYARVALSQNGDTHNRERVLDMLKSVNTDQGLKSLLMGLMDFDQCVQCKACQILLKIRQECEKYGLGEGDGTGEPGLKKARLEKEPCDVLKSDSCKWREGVTCEEFIGIIERLDLDLMMTQVSESTDNYVRNPLTLFDDILTSLANDDEGEDNAIDCY